MYGVQLNDVTCPDTWWRIWNKLRLKWVYGGALLHYHYVTMNYWERCGSATTKFPFALVFFGKFIIDKHKDGDTPPSYQGFMTLFILIEFNLLYKFYII